MASKVALLVLSLTCVQAAVQRPSYLKTCLRNDPKLNECALKKGREMIPSLIPGDKNIRLPPLDPLVLEKLEIRPTGNSQSAGLSLTCFNCALTGLRQATLEDIKIDLKKQHLDLDISIPKLNIQGKYEVSGNVLVLAINGKGDANLTIDSINLKIGLDWEDKQKKGNLHSHITGYKVDFTVARLYIYFDNLFNGDKLLGENMNTFLNENWEAVLTDFRPAIGQTVGETVKLILNNIFEIIPFDMLFPEK